MDALAERLGKQLALDPYRASIVALVAAVRSLSVTRRRKLIRLCERALENPELRRNEVDRVSVVKLLVALVPQSTSTVKSWIEHSENRFGGEVQFSLFCFLDDLSSVPGAEGFRKEVPLILARYLWRVRTNAAQAAWMAGDLLGDHWDLRESLPVLIEAARRAKFVAGRAGALHGLAHAKLRARGGELKAIVSVLKEVDGKDRSRTIRKYAAGILSGRDACLGW